MFENNDETKTEFKTYILRTGEFKTFFNLILELPPLLKKIYIEDKNKYIINFLY